jgi:hypothetical protein
MSPPDEWTELNGYEARLEVAYSRVLTVDIRYSHRGL